MNVACFYHCYAAGNWREPALEQLAALEASGFEGPVFLGVIGPLAERERVTRLWESMGGRATVIEEADVGHEQVTIGAVHRYAMQNGGAVLYAHTKGASADTPFNAAWRRAMTLRVVSRWQQNAAVLERDVDAVGCHWLTPARYKHWGCESPFFGGNFWMARCDYLRTLPACSKWERYDAEAWIGRCNPRVVDLFEGWPGERQWPEQPAFAPVEPPRQDFRSLDGRATVQVRSDRPQLSPGGQACFETR